MLLLEAPWISLWIKALALARQIWEFRLMRVLRLQWMLQTYLSPICLLLPTSQLLGDTVVT
jgi:hypothetical protein